MTLSSVDIRVLIHELQDSVVGAWIVNVYQLPSGIFILKLRQSQAGNKLLLVEPGKRIHLTQFNRQMPKMPPNFCLQLRAHVKDRRINSISQVNVDRIVEINYGADEQKIYIELFGKGNLIVTSAENKILLATSYRKMKDRDIHPGRLFEFPPLSPTDIIREGPHQLQKFLIDETNIIFALNKYLGLGPQYSKYILKRANIVGKRIEKISTEQISSLDEAIVGLYEQLINHEYDPVVLLDPEVNDDSAAGEYESQWADDELDFNPEQVLKIQPWLLNSMEDVEIYHPKSYNTAIDIFESSQEDVGNLQEAAEELETEADRLKRRLADQQEHQRKMFEEAEMYRLQADALYLNFGVVDELLTTIYSARKKKISWENILEKLDKAKELGMPSAQIIKKINPNAGNVKIKIQGEQGDVVLSVNFTKSIQEIADTLYSKAKKQEKRGKGAEKAIALTLEKISVAEQNALTRRKEVAAQIKILRRRKRWYEKWHWAVAPDGVVIIGGLDATTNERLVKKYLDDDDLFLHADIHGAPFVAIKSAGKEISEQTEYIAATIGVCYSSAWKGKRASADAFILPPDQVSLQAPSGEFLPKGSIVLTGKKQFIRNIPLEIYIGVIIESNWARLVAGSKILVEDCNYWVKIKPGDMQRGKIAKRIRDLFMSWTDEASKQKINALDVSEFAMFVPDASEIVEKSVSE